VSYRICDVEVTATLPPIELGEGVDGIAVLVRRYGRPVWFWMEAVPPGSRIEPDELRRRIGAKAAVPLLKEAIREELIDGRHSPAESPRFRLTIAVCTKDRSERLARCLDSLPREAHEILVVDNAPSDGRTREVVTKRPGVRYVCEPKPGLDFARNRALAEAMGDYVAFIDDDVVVDREWLPGLVEAWHDHPDAAAFTGLILPLALDSEAQILFEKLGGFRGGPGEGFDKIRWGKVTADSVRYPCDAGVFGSGANMVVRRDVAISLGGFDDALDTGRPLPGGGDLDIFYRIIRAGHAIAYEPRCLVFHEHRSDLSALRRQYWSWGSGFMAFAAKSLRSDPSQRAKWRRLLAWWFAKYQSKRLAKAVLRRSAPRPDMVLAEIFGALAGLLGGYRRSVRRIERIRREAA
jgi:glycosyltransferase involved in cell wall biosynthesis